MKPPFQLTSKILSLIASISERIGEINSAHLNIPPTELRKKNRIKTIQSSLEIEGNTLTIEQITAILENKLVIGPPKDITEVKNAIQVYNKLHEFDSCSMQSFCMAHQILMAGLIESAGRLRSGSVGILKGSEIAHIAPPGEMVSPLMSNLFNYLKNDGDLVLIKSCVFHYELEFIHPFADGNGRMGRLWQTLILRDKYPVFEFLPVESIIKERQTDYYEALGQSDRLGESTPFIEFMLEIILQSLQDLLKTPNVTLTSLDRINGFRSKIQGTYFTRKDYLQNFKEISTATASRDLKLACKQGILQKSGMMNATKYCFS